MKPHQQRVIDEAFELQERLIKLESFGSKPDYEKLSEENKILLKDQFETMKRYFDILRARISLFE